MLHSRADAQEWLAELGLTRVRVNASLLLPYFDFVRAAGAGGPGRLAEGPNFQAQYRWPPSVPAAVGRTAARSWF